MVCIVFVDTGSVIFFPMANIQLDDYKCPICKDIFEKPIKTPCCHRFCLDCFDASFHKTTLLCPICKRRCSSWWRKHPNKQDLVDKELWDYIQQNFHIYRDIKNLGLNVELPSSNSVIQDSQGEIGEEFSQQMKEFEKEMETLREKEEQESFAFIRTMLESERQERSTANKKTKTAGPIDRYVSRVCRKAVCNKKAMPVDVDVDAAGLKDFLAEHELVMKRLEEERNDLKLAKRLSRNWELKPTDRKTRSGFFN